MTDTEIFRRTHPVRGWVVKQWPVILRGTIWVTIAVLTDLRTSIHDLVVSPDKLAQIKLVGWMDIAMGAVLAGAIALRLYLDGSAARHQQNLQAEEMHIPYPQQKQTV